MALSIICDCGARFDVDEAFAGKEVNCPECLHTLRTPELDRIPRRTSSLALTSVVLALVGAFTVVGSLAGACVGLVALLMIIFKRDRLRGVGFAVFGIVAGLGFTALTLLGLQNSSEIGLGAWLRQNQMKGQLDTSGSLEITRPAQGFTITRPSEEWGIIKDKKLDDPSTEPLQKKLDLLLAKPGEFAFVDVRIDLGSRAQTIEDCVQEVQADLVGQPNENMIPGFMGQRRGPFGPEDPERLRIRFRSAWPVFRDLPGPLPPGFEARELEDEVICGRQRWTFIIRLYKKEKGPLYVIRAYAPTKRFPRVREELENAIQSFHDSLGR